MHGPLSGEFMGTMVLVLSGDGVVANVLLKKSKGEGTLARTVEDNGGVYWVKVLQRNGLI
jgi:glycerol uptake facilitator-like aquaporin